MSNYVKNKEVAFSQVRNCRLKETTCQVGVKEKAAAFYYSDYRNSKIAFNKYISIVHVFYLVFILFCTSTKNEL